jgi:hypothetical protein
MAFNTNGTDFSAVLLPVGGGFLLAALALRLARTRILYGQA